MNRRLAWILMGMMAACGQNEDSPDARQPTPHLPDAAAAAGPDAAASGPDGGTGTSLVERGDYLVNTVIGCPECHTPRNPDGSFDQTKALSGVDCFVDADPTNAAVGCLSSRNLTPDQTGLMTRTDEQIKTMFRDGVRPGGQALVPIMPYYLFHRMTDDDASAIVAYLRTLPAVQHMVAANQPPFDNVPAPAPVLTEDEVPAAGGTGATHDSAVRGRYLASVGLCIDCHTPETAPGSPRPIDITKAFQGGRAFPAAAFGFPSPPFPEVVYSVNLTPHATGIADYDVETIVRALHQGLDAAGHGICPPMPSAAPGPANYFANLTDDDATDIANYLLNLEPVENMIPAECVAPGP